MIYFWVFQISFTSVPELAFQSDVFERTGYYSWVAKVILDYLNLRAGGFLVLMPVSKSCYDISDVLNYSSDLLILSFTESHKIRSRM